MKKNYFLLLFIVIYSNSFSQSPTIQWQKCLGGSDEDILESVIQTSDGGYIVAGSTNSTDFDALDNHGGRDFLVVKIDETGLTQWRRCYGGTNNELAYSIIQTSDGGYLVGGETNSNDGDVSGNTFNSASSHSWLIKINDLGEILWQRVIAVGQIGGSIKSIYEDSDNKIIITGDCYAAQYTLSYNDGFITKLNSDGSNITQSSGWTTPLLLGGDYHDYIRTMSPTDDGGYILAGITYSRDGIFSSNHGTFPMGDLWIVKVDVFGAIQWQRLYGGSGNTEVNLTGNDQANSIIQTSDGGYAVAGFTMSNNDGDVSGNNGLTDYWVLKLDNEGDLIWQKCFGGSGDDEANSIIQNSDGGYTVAGFSRLTTGSIITGNNGLSDYWLVRINTDGDVLWEKSLGGTSWDEAQSIISTNDGGYLVSGTTWSNICSNNLQDFWIVKLSPETLSNNLIENSGNFIYPNPTNDILNLNLSNNDVIEQIFIYDNFGKKVYEQHSNITNINISNLSSGIYMIVVQSNNTIFKNKFLKQ